MKVKELIEKLQKLDQEAEVVTYDHEWGKYYYAYDPKFIGAVKVGGGFGILADTVEKAVEI